MVGEGIIIISIIAIINNNRNYLIIILSFELILISISYLFIYYSLSFDDIIGIIYTILLLVIGAAETAIGLTLIMLLP